MDFRHLIVTCLFSKLRLPFDNQKVKENYAIFFEKIKSFLKKNRSFFKNNRMFLMLFYSYCITWQNTLFFFQKFQLLRKRPVHRLFG